MASWCQRAAAENISVAVFPEACLTGYCRPRQMAELAQPFAGRLRERAAEIASQNNVLLAFGMPEREGEACYNTMIALGPNGELLARYRKMHLWAAESKWAVPGNEYATFQAELAHFGLMLCYDTRFPEMVRCLALAGVEVALVSSAWRASHVEEWRLCARARAIDNGIFVAGSDAVLDADHFQCAGGSLITGPDGSVRALAEKGEEGMIAVAIDTEEIKARRRDLPLLAHRRPELYGGLVEGAENRARSAKR
jgi:predicted amidohydrolase